MNNVDKQFKYVVNTMRLSNICLTGFTEEENKNKRKATFEFPRIEEKFKSSDWKIKVSLILINKTIREKLFFSSIHWSNRNKKNIYSVQVHKKGPWQILKTQYHTD